MSCQFSGAFLFLLLRFQFKAWFGILQSSVYGRPHIGANGVSGPPWKMDEKLKSENMQKEQFSMIMLYFESNQGRHVCRQRRHADYIFIQIYPGTSECTIS